MLAPGRRAAVGACRVRAGERRSLRSRAVRCAACSPGSSTGSSRCARTPGGRSARPTSTRSARRTPVGGRLPSTLLEGLREGHLNDFPWVGFLHGTVACTGTLRLVRACTTQAPRPARSGPHPRRPSTASPVNNRLRTSAHSSVSTATFGSAWRTGACATCSTRTPRSSPRFASHHAGPLIAAADAPSSSPNRCCLGRRLAASCRGRRCSFSREAITGDENVLLRLVVFDRRRFFIRRLGFELRNHLQQTLRKLLARVTKLALPVISLGLR